MCGRIRDINTYCKKIECGRDASQQQKASASAAQAGNTLKEPPRRASQGKSSAAAAAASSTSSARAVVRLLPSVFNDELSSPLTEKTQSDKAFEKGIKVLANPSDNNKKAVDKLRGLCSAVDVIGNNNPHSRSYFFTLTAIRACVRGNRLTSAATALLAKLDALTCRHKAHLAEIAGLRKRLKATEQTSGDTGVASATVAIMLPTVQYPESAADFYASNHGRSSSADKGVFFSNFESIVRVLKLPDEATWLARIEALSEQCRETLSTPDEFKHDEDLEAQIRRKAKPLCDANEQLLSVLIEIRERCKAVQRGNEVLVASIKSLRKQLRAKPKPSKEGVIDSAKQHGALAQGAAASSALPEGDTSVNALSRGAAASSVEDDDGASISSTKAVIFDLGDTEKPGRDVADAGTGVKRSMGAAAAGQASADTVARKPTTAAAALLMRAQTSQQLNQELANAKNALSLFRKKYFELQQQYSVIEQELSQTILDNRQLSVALSTGQAQYAALIARAQAAERRVAELEAQNAAKSHLEAKQRLEKSVQELQVQLKAAQERAESTEKRCAALTARLSAQSGPPPGTSADSTASVTLASAASAAAGGVVKKDDAQVKTLDEAKAALAKSQRLVTILREELKTAQKEKKKAEEKLLDQAGEVVGSYPYDAEVLPLLCRKYKEGSHCQAMQKALARVVVAYDQLQGTIKVIEASQPSVRHSGRKPVVSKIGKAKATIENLQEELKNLRGLLVKQCQLDPELKMRLEDNPALKALIRKDEKPKKPPQAAAAASTRSGRPAHH